METTKIKLPEGKEAYGITAIPYEGYIKVDYELKDSWKPRNGDFVSYIANSTHYVFIYKRMFKNIIENYAALNTTIGELYTGSLLHFFYPIIRPATKEEKQQLLDAMHKEGKDWDEERREIVYYKWLPKYGDWFYCINENMSISKHQFLGGYNTADLCSCNNIFQTEEEAKSMRNRLQKVLYGAKLEGE